MLGVDQGLLQPTTITLRSLLPVKECLIVLFFLFTMKLYSLLRVDRRWELLSIALCVLVVLEVWWECAIDLAHGLRADLDCT